MLKMSSGKVSDMSINASRLKANASRKVSGEVKRPKNTSNATRLMSVTRLVCCMSAEKLYIRVFPCPNDNVIDFGVSGSDFKVKTKQRSC